MQHRALRAESDQCLARSDSFIAPNDIATAIATYVDDEESLVDVMLTSTCLDSEIFVVPRLYELAADDK